MNAGSTAISSVHLRNLMDLNAIADRYAQVKSTIPAHVKLVAVSKTRSPDEIRALYALGQRAFGENYPQELKEKQARLPADIEWHFIGHLQRSNVKQIVAFTHLVHAIDSTKLMDELDKRAAVAGRSVDVLFQVHIAREDTKHGFHPDELRTLLQQPGIAGRWPHVRPRGLMGMATNTEDRAQVSHEFAAVAKLFRETRSAGSYGKAQFNQLSMGMTGDMDLAIAAGSTMVRVGTALFGERG